MGETTTGDFDYNLMTEWKDTNDTTVDESGPGSVFRSGIAVEIKFAGAAAPGGSGSLGAGGSSRIIDFGWLMGGGQPALQWQPFINRTSDRQSHAPLEVNSDRFPILLLDSGALLFQSFEETLGTPGLTETLTLLRKKVFSETTLLSETLVKTVRKFFTETASLAEVFVKKMFRTFAETTGLSETLGIVTRFLRSFSETLSLSETLTLLRKKVFAETTSFTEVIVKKVKMAFAETLNSLTEALTTLVIPGSPGGAIHTMASWVAQAVRRIAGRR